MLPAPHLVVVGRSVAVDTPLRLAAGLGWETVAVDDGGRPDAHPDAGRTLTTLDLRSAGVHAGSFVVVATQGHYDEEALEAALATPAAYVGLVASTCRVESVLGTTGRRTASAAPAAAPPSAASPTGTRQHGA